MKSKPTDPKEAAKRVALRALRKAKLAAVKAGIDLSEWEGEFVLSVEDRLRTYGRAFADPEKGAPGHALSALQTRKLKEITAKARGEEKPRPGWKRRPDAGSDPGPGEG